MRKRRGSMLIEVMLGFGVAMVGLTAILQLTSRSVNNSGNAQREARAGRLADEGIDWVKGQVNTVGWTVFAGNASPVPSPASNYCLNQLVWQGGACSGGSVVPSTEFVRNLQMYSEVDATTLKTMVTAVVIVGWGEGNRQDSVTRAYQFVPH